MIYKFFNRYTLQEEAGAEAGAASAGAAETGATETGAAETGTEGTLLSGEAEASADGTLLSGEAEAKTTDEGGEAKAEAEGAPENYEDFDVPEGVSLDAKDIEAFSGVARELNLTQEQAQKLVTYEADRAKKAQDAHVSQVEALFTGFLDKTKSDPEIGGDKLQESVARAKHAMQTFGNDEFTRLMNDHPIGNHPEMIRFLTKVDVALREDVPGGGGRGGEIDRDQQRLKQLYPND